MGNEGSKDKSRDEPRFESNEKSDSALVGIAGALIGAGLMYLGTKLFASGENPKTEKCREENEEKEQEEKTQTKKTENDDEVPESFICPISGEIMKDPVITPTGVSYEKANIEAWLKKKEVDPLSKKRLTVNDLIPNRSLKEAIEEFMKKLK